jgi:threonine dehydrogenase-like Zn-dependent dehydrogenase
MLALVLDREPRLIRDHPRPERRAGEARIRVRLAGVCDTDLALARGYMGFCGVLGHEFVGEVIEADDARWRARRVVADINAGCGACEECRQRRGHHCRARSVLGIVARDGAFAEELTIPERCLVEVPDSVADECAVFAEPLAAAAHVLDDLPPGRPPDEPVLVLGDGKLGQLIVRGLVGAGARVLLVGHHAEKLALARAAGAEGVLEDDLGSVPERFTCVVEATGSVAGMRRALALTAPRGTVVLKTTVAGASEVDLSPIVIDELRLVGSRCGDMGLAIELLTSGRVDPRPLISARFPLERADQALARAAQPGTLKVLIEGIQR